MKHIGYLLLALVLLGLLLAPATALAAGPQWVVVNWGDTLSSLAARFGSTPEAMMRANNLPTANFIFTGQRLTIPASSAGGLPQDGSGAVIYTVQPGDQLSGISTRYGSSQQDIANANALYNLNTLYAGQRLIIPFAAGPGTAAVKAPVISKPPATSGVPASGSAPVSANPASAGKWIDVNIKKQTITAYEGSVPVKSNLVSTGIAIHPTVVGHYQINSKLPVTVMSGGSRASGDYYYLPGVRWVMYFYSGYAIHGTYWHHNFGHPMSHGCVNLSNADAEWFYNWAPIGTPVITHY